MGKCAVVYGDFLAKREEEDPKTRKRTWRQYLVYRCTAAGEKALERKLSYDDKESEGKERGTSDSLCMGK